MLACMPYETHFRVEVQYNADIEANLIGLALLRKPKSNTENPQVCCIHKHPHLYNDVSLQVHLSEFITLFILDTLYEVWI